MGSAVEALPPACAFRIEIAGKGSLPERMRNYSQTRFSIKHFTNLYVFMQLRSPTSVSTNKPCVPHLQADKQCQQGLGLWIASYCMVKVVRCLPDAARPFLSG